MTGNCCDLPVFTDARGARRGYLGSSSAHLARPPDELPRSQTPSMVVLAGEMGRRGGVPGRAGLGARGRWLVGALAGLGVLAVSVLVAVGSASPARHPMSASSRWKGWGSVPAAARGAISSRLGAIEPGYRVQRMGPGLIAVSPAQGLRARFGVGGVSAGSGATRRLVCVS